MRYDCFLFDLDGTLLDTLDDLTDAVNYALKKNGYSPRTREEVRAFIGNGVVKLTERAIGQEKESCENFDTVFKDFKLYYGEHCEDKTRAYEGVIELLTALKAAGKKVGVVSNKAAFAVEKLCEAYFGELVGVAIGENESAGVKKKPAPDTVLLALKALNAKKETAVYVGDSEVDILTAKNAELPCISVSWGMKDGEFLLANGADVLVDTPDQIEQFI
ncbi:MAG: HAD family hydrolase [Clostridia bacterium]|nr:HAD family hydrolase [Clostridia bacterium]